MKKFSVLALGAVIGLCSIPRADAAVQFGRTNDRRGDQVCVYKDINYQGAEQCYSGGGEMGNLGTQSRSISSIRIYGRATVTVYENTAFRGHSAQFTSDVADLGQRMMSGNTPWSDHIESLRTTGVSGTAGPDVVERRNPDNFPRNQDNYPRNQDGRQQQQQQQPRDGICVYDRPNYEGASECWIQGRNIADVARQGTGNRQISSIRLFGPAVAIVYRDIGYRGESLTVDRDIPDLAAIAGRNKGNGNGNGNGKGNGNGNGNGKGDGNGRGKGLRFDNWDGQISSLQVRAQRRNR